MKWDPVLWRFPGSSNHKSFSIFILFMPIVHLSWYTGRDITSFDSHDVLSMICWFFLWDPATTFLCLAATGNNTFYLLYFVSVILLRQQGGLLVAFLESIYNKSFLFTKSSKQFCCFLALSWKKHQFKLFQIDFQLFLFLEHWEVYLEIFISFCFVL